MRLRCAAGQYRNYGKADPGRADASLPGIRALPADAADVLIWTGEIYRWQDHPDRDALNSPLMNLTWEFQSRDVAPMEGLTVDSFPYVSFETKLGILARQMQRHRSEFAPNPVWCAIQQTLANRFSVGASA